ncbi:rhomboid family intramembrane serine protease [Alkanindiges hydrocarboniclasticus]|jgi:membrane associated rhomboid family serine protease|uniref:Rhomboid family intramembrane serine protease n=1 Tax=Alkanindiges hydrocarboniclasticus TaxID=1907941 RepID=A0A1S8CXX5_9GAMM|nr:rhomboid family intramembrane serine protease [Alkanindiges hydrocarboniclasticus]ONG41896.1 rhomboid family intramembrane serine protease [Alkanindiges hydrocarboniclasticus]
MLGLPFSHTLTLIIITCLLSFIAFSNRTVMNRLIMWPPAMRRGQFDRFITYGFVHADGTHLLFNMITLYFFGRAIEAFYRPYFAGMGFILFYLAALVVAMLPSYFKHKNDPNYLSLGASGAVSAVLFAYILFAPWNLIFVFFIPMPAIVYALLYTAYTVYSARRGKDNINHSAHLWGAGFGVVATIAIEPRLVPRFMQELLQLH